jgi:hypothetical protein
MKYLIGSTLAGLLLMGGFGEPVSGGGAEPGAGADAGAPLPSSEPQEMLDMNDPRLTAEPLDVNVEGDAYTMPPPPPDGRYKGKLKLVQVEDAAGAKHDYLPKLGKKPPKLPYYYTAIEVSIIDPSGKFDGLKVFDRWVGTFQNRDGSTKVQTILSKLVKADGTPWITKQTRLNHKDWMDLFVKVLATEPEIGVETVWEWSCQGCGEKAKAAGTDYPKSVLGMNKFPVDNVKSKQLGVQTYSPDMACQVDKAHGFSSARASVARFLSLAELKK